MNEPNPKSAVDLELKRLEKRLEDLIVTVSHIKEESGLAPASRHLDVRACDAVAKNEQVRAGRAMIGRLKSMEQA